MIIRKSQIITFPINKFVKSICLLMLAFILSACGGAAETAETTETSNSSPSLNHITDITVSEGEAVTFTPSGTDPDNDTLTFSYSGWMTSGSYATVNGDIGTHSVTVTVEDGNGGSDSQIVQIRVNAVYTFPEEGNIYYVSSTGSNGNAGTVDEPFPTISEAASAAEAGDTVLIREGTYEESLVPQNSGEANNYITFRNYPNETVIITGSLQPAIDISDRQYLIIEGLTIRNVRRWMYAINSHHNIIRNNDFSGASDGSSRAGLFFEKATNNQVRDNLLVDTAQDNLSLIQSDKNVIEGNRIEEAAHTLWTIKCGNYNVIRDNYFYNEDQKVGEIYDCGTDGGTTLPGSNHDILSLDDTKYNLVENNKFAFGVKYYSTSGGNGIQYAGQNGIIRHNEFYRMNVGFGMQRYSQEAMYNKYNRVYNNVFYQNECGGISLRNEIADQYLDNIFKNNILYDNSSCGGTGDGQVLYRTGVAGNMFTHNNILAQTPGDDVIDNEHGSDQSLSYFESNYSTLFMDNLEVNPLFENAAAFNFNLTDSSPMIDAGDFLTQTSSSGSGTVLTVDDAGYFYDGFGIEGQTGDVIQIEGQTTTATITAIDYDNNILALDRSLTWSSGDGVNLIYNGNAPDMGVYESGF